MLFIFTREHWRSETSRINNKTKRKGQGEAEKLRAIAEVSRQTCRNAGKHELIGKAINYKCIRLIYVKNTRVFVPVASGDVATENPWQDFSDKTCYDFRDSWWNVSMVVQYWSVDWKLQNSSNVDTALKTKFRGNGWKIPRQGRNKVHFRRVTTRSCVLPESRANSLFRVYTLRFWKSALCIM